MCKNLSYLGEDHLGQYCNRTRVSGQNNCKELLLHRDHNRSQTKEIRSDLIERGHKNIKNEANLEVKGDQLTYMHKLTYVII